VKTNRHKSMKGVDPKVGGRCRFVLTFKFRRNARWAALGTQKAVAEARKAKASA
jgi:large subunit ribosomal protein L29e